MSHTKLRYFFKAVKTIPSVAVH